jgi:hypothetical protein
VLKVRQGYKVLKEILAFKAIQEMVIRERLVFKVFKERQGYREKQASKVC